MENGKDPRRTVRVFGVGLIVVLAAGAVAAPGPAGGRGGYGGGGGYGERTPTPTPSRTAVPAPTQVAPPPKDTVKPGVNSRPSRGQTARSILKRGLRISVQCNEDCRHGTQVFVSKSQARKLRIKPKAKRRVLVGRKTTLLKATVAKTITVKFSKKAKQGIRRMKARKVKKLKLTIATAATDAANNVARSSTTMSFKR